MLLMDNLDAENYIERGMLEDISGIMEKQGSWRIFRRPMRKRTEVFTVCL